eukprot:6697531-Prymnesium_polylepis.1
MHTEGVDPSAQPLFEHYSRTFAPYPSTNVTLAFNDSDGKATLLVCDRPFDRQYRWIDDKVKRVSGDRLCNA